MTSYIDDDILIKVKPLPYKFRVQPDEVDTGRIECTTEEFQTIQPKPVFHQKKKRTSSVVTENNAQINFYCKNHQEEVLADFYCITHEHYICVDCYRGHRDHESDSILNLLTKHFNEWY
jgi:hypothetical protein